MQSEITAAATLIAPYIRVTPIVALEAGGPILKLESLQHTGSFKARGAFASMLALPVPPAGVVAASGGNHGVAVAHAARRLGVKARIFVPAGASATKVARIRATGAELVIGGEGYDDAFAASEEWREQSGARGVHAYDQPETIAGQGTLGRELAGQAELDTVLVAVGGGGLIAGVAGWYAGAVRIVGVEPRRAPTLHGALEAGRPVDVEVSGIAADSLGARRIGARVFPIAARHVSQVVLVEDEEIREAQRQLWGTLQVVAEPGGAAAFAALTSGRYRPGPGERVGVIICGGNSDAVDFG